VIKETRKDDNKMEYEVVVVLEGQIYGTGTGTSKQDAEQAAARESLAKLKK
jgi:dsRNA-specific ribonuclease